MTEKDEEKKIHNYDAAWKNILTYFPKEIIELLFPRIAPHIDWSYNIESLEQELGEIETIGFDKRDSEDIIADKIMRVYLKNGIKTSL